MRNTDGTAFRTVGRTVGRTMPPRARAPKPHTPRNFTTFVTEQPTLQQISSSTDMTREDELCVCGHDHRLHGPTRCHWLDCGYLTFDSEQVRR